MTASAINSSGEVRVLGSSTGVSDAVTEEDVKDEKKLSRLVLRLVQDVAALRKRWYPRRVDFEDIAVSTGGARIYLNHNFNGRVRWHICEWPDSAGAAPDLRGDATNTTSNILVLRSYVGGTATIRVEEAG